MDILINIFVKYEIGLFFIVDLEFLRKIIIIIKKKRLDGLFEVKFVFRRMCCVYLFLLFSLFMKIRNEFSLYFRWEVREGGICVS